MLLQVPVQDAATRGAGNDERTASYRVGTLRAAHEGACTRASPASAPHRCAAALDVVLCRTLVGGGQGGALACAPQLREDIGHSSEHLVGGAGGCLF
jgi:hypothetical protein